MARITVEDCMQFVSNRYELVHLCTRRSRQLHRGAERLVHSKNNDVVTALREIAAGKVRFLPTTNHAANDDVTDSNLTQ